MASSEDYKKLYELYQVEGLPQGVSIIDFCQRNGIVYKHFERWFKKRYSQTDSPVHRIRLSDPDSLINQPLSDDPHSDDRSNSSRQDEQVAPQVRLYVSIRTTQGLIIQHNNLTYRQLLSLVEKLEVLC